MTPVTNIAYETTWLSPAGSMRLAVTDAGICQVAFVEDSGIADQPDATKTLHPHLQHLINELTGYFSGTLKDFTVPLAVTGTPFQHTVWKAIAQIPYGHTLTYAELATQLGNPQSIRAVANANAQNPVLVVCPCHRVIGSNGDLTGYAGGLHRKQLLLELEGVLHPDRQMSLDL